MSTCHSSPGFMRIKVICVLIILSQHISLGVGQEECEDLPKLNIVSEGSTTGKVLANFTQTGSEVLVLSLTPQTGFPSVLSLDRTGNLYRLIITRDLDAENVSRIGIKYDLQCSYGNRPPVNYVITLQVKNINDNSPVFGGPMSVSIPESLKPGNEVYRLQGKATDADIVENDITYEINAQNKFQITGSHSVGSVILNSSLDYETGPKQYFLIVTAKDSATQQNSATATLTIRVQDVDDQNPVFNTTAGSVWSVPELFHNTTQRTFTVSAYDPDTGVPPVAIKYRLPTDHGLFSINEDTGEVSISQPLDIDRGQTDSYFLFIQAYQEDKPTLRVSSTLLEVRIQDVNDNSPVMSPDTYTISLPENTHSGVVVTQVSATDIDQGINSEFGYFIAAQSDNAFKIDRSTGEIAVDNSSLLDAERVTTFTFQVYAQELATQERRRSQMANVLITLEDANDNSPAFNQTSYEFIIEETVSRGHLLGKVYATDADSGDNGEVRYSLADGGYGEVRYSLADGGSTAAQLFALDSVTGQLTVQGNISVNTYSLFVTASDQSKTTAQRRSTVRVTIHVLDVNNHRPEFVSQQRSFNVTEGLQNYLVTNLLVKGGDTSDSLHCFVGGDTTQFHIYYSGPHRGCVVECIKSLDREKIPQYTLTILLFDGRNAVSTELFINVLDVNDNSPQFAQALYAFSIAEGVYTGQTIGAVTATDADEGVNSEITFGFEYTQPAGWNVSPDTGEITFTGLIDCEEEESFDFLIQARDNGQPSLMNLVRVVIDVLDVNDNSPQFVQKSVNVWLPENSGPGLIYTAEATDADVSSENSEVMYLMASGDETLFGVSEDGRLFTKQPLHLDSGAADGYTITLEAYNRKPYSTASVANDTMVVHVRV